MFMTEKMKENFKDWAEVFIQVGMRFGNAITNIPFLVSFGVGVVGIGGLGIWIDNHYNKEINMDLFTVSMAILGTLILDGITKNNKNNLLTSVAILLGSFAIYFLFIGLDLQNKSDLITGYIIVLVLYFFTESNKPEYDSRKNADMTGKKNATAEELHDWENN